MYKNNFNEPEMHWGNSRIDQSPAKPGKWDKNKWSKPSHKGNENRNIHIINEDLLGDFTVSTVKHVNENSHEESLYAEVAFKCKRKKLYKNENNLHLNPYEYVVAQVENGIDLGTVCCCGRDALEKYKTIYKNEVPEYTILRFATKEDIDRLKKNSRDESVAIEKTKELVKDFSLEMKVTESEWQLDRQRLTIYFTAPQRIDFRELVKELAKTFKTRIELRQISTREEAKRIGGMGPCGLHLCCASFVNEFSHVTLDHARAQQLAYNVAKLSGYCGRLKCCLLYEHEDYLEEYKNYPAINSTVELKEGIAKITKIDIFKKLIYLQLNDNEQLKVLNNNEVKELQKEGKVRPPEKEDSLPSIEIDELDLLSYLEEDVY